MIQKNQCPDEGRAIVREKKESQVYYQRIPERSMKTMLEKDVFRLFVHPGEAVELRIMGLYNSSHLWSGYAKGIVSGYFDSFEKFKQAVLSVDRLRHEGIYFTLQVIDNRLLGRAFNRLIAAKKTTSDRDVLFYRWLPVDFDPVRPAGVSSSEIELKKALAVRNLAVEWIRSTFDFDEPIRAISGNGGHLLFRLPDWKNTTDTVETIKGMITDISTKFSTDVIDVDLAVGNPGRIWKVYGSKARKGDEIPVGPRREARPYRTAYIDVLPKEVLHA